MNFFRFLLQLLGLQCRHAYLSRPFHLKDRIPERVCRDCGQRFPHRAYRIEEEGLNSITHYEVKEKSVSRVNRRLLKFKKKKESVKNG